MDELPEIGGETAGSGVGVSTATLAQTPVQNQVNGTTLACTITAATAGNKLIVGAGIIDAVNTLNTPSDNISGTTGWTLKYDPGAASGNRHYWWEKEAVGGETTITVTPSASDTYHMCVWEVIDLIDTDSFDVGARGNGAAAGGTITTALSGTLAQPNELVLALATVNNTFSADTFTDSIITPTTYPASGTKQTRGDAAHYLGRDETTSFTVSFTFSAAASRSVCVTLTTWMAVDRPPAARNRPTPLIRSTPSRASVSGV